MRLRDMKKLFIALAAVALTACVKAPEKTVKVYAWQGEGGNTTEQTLQADFSKWHAHGVDGMCYNAGHDTEKIQRAAKAAHANGMEYHAWIPAMLQHGIGLHPLRREPERRVGLFRTGVCALLQMPVPEPRRYGGVLAESVWQGSRYPGGGLYPSGLYPLRGCHPGPRTLGKIRLGDGRGISYGGLLLL